MSMKWAEVRQISAQAIIRRKCAGSTWLAAGFQAVVHRRRKAGLVAAQAGLDAAGHLFVHERIAGGCAAASVSAKRRNLNSNLAPTLAVQDGSLRRLDRR